MTKDQIEFLLAIGALIGMAYAGWKFVWPLLVALKTMIERLDATIDAVLGTPNHPGIGERIEQQARDIAMLKSEVLPNGGTSLNDRVMQSLGEQRAFLDGNPRLGFFSTNKRGGLVWANQTYLRWSGTQLEKVLGRGWLGLIHPDDRDDVAAEWLAAVEDARGSTFRFRMADGQGGYRDVLGEAQPMHNGRGGITGWYGHLVLCDAEGRPQ